MISRRTLLAGTAVTAVGGALAACTATQQAQLAQAWTNFIDGVNSILAKGCGVLPAFTATANTIEAIVGLIYPSISAAIAAGATAISTVAGKLCATVPTASKPMLAARLHANSAMGIATIIGTTKVNGTVVQVHGYEPR